MICIFFAVCIFPQKISKSAHIFTPAAGIFTLQNHISTFSSRIPPPLVENPPFLREVWDFHDYRLKSITCGQFCAAGEKILGYFTVIKGEMIPKVVFFGHPQSHRIWIILELLRHPFETSPLVSEGFDLEGWVFGFKMYWCVANVH